MLAVNTAVHTSDHIDVWLDSTKKGERSRFLKPRFSVNATGQAVTALRDEAAFVPPGDVVYELKVGKYTIFLVILAEIVCSGDGRPDTDRR